MQSTNQSHALPQQSQSQRSLIERPGSFVFSVKIKLLNCLMTKCLIAYQTRDSLFQRTNQMKLGPRMVSCNNEHCYKYFFDNSRSGHIIKQIQNVWQKDNDGKTALLTLCLYSSKIFDMKKISIKDHLQQDRLHVGLVNCESSPFITQGASLRCVVDTMRMSRKLRSNTCSWSLRGCVSNCLYNAHIFIRIYLSASQPNRGRTKLCSISLHQV